MRTSGKQRESTITPPQAHLLLSQGKQLDLPPGAVWLVGRTTPHGAPVDLDLGPFGAGELGVSRHHARISQQAAGYSIEDLDSHNETSINGERISPGQIYPLAHGDRIAFGLLRCVFLCES